MRSEMSMFHNGKMVPTESPDIAQENSDARMTAEQGCRNTRVRVRDVVIIRGSDTSRRTRLALVRRLFQKPSPTSVSIRQYLHVHWMSESPLGLRNELFLLEGQCADVPARLVSESIPYTFGRHKAKAGRVNERFYRFVLSTSPLVIRDPRTDVRCDACSAKVQLREQTHAKPLTVDLSLSEAPTQTQGLSYRAFDLHRHDFVFLDSGAAGQEWTIGQILNCPDLRGETEAVNVILRVKIFSRRKKDEPQVLSTNEIRDVRLETVVGKCRIISPETDFDPHLDPFGIQCDKAISHCRSCKIKPVAPGAAPRLPCMDLYTGGGGTILGARPYFNPITAIDNDETSCQTLSQNFPEMKVEGAKVADLHHEAQYKRGPLPKKGSIFMLTACPPCQSHSGANLHKSATDYGPNELFVTFSECARLRPDIFVFENVPGFLSHRDDGTFVVDGIKSSGKRSFAQMAIELLIESGYQFRLAVLDSRSYGSPQNRRRCFILAARSGVTLPSFPQPTHANPGVRSTKLSSSMMMAGESRETKYHIGRGTPGTGPYPAVTVRDAIGDLPPFHFRISGMPHSRVPTFDAMRHGHRGEMKAGFGHTAYASDPLTRYQRELRGDNRVIVDHFTPPRSASELQLIRQAFEAPQAVVVEGNARRVDPNGGFYTLMTSSAPGHKNTGPIHYSQHRTFTIAERKRAQGVPDGYKLAGTVFEQDRQLGNMVDVNIGKAIYGSIYKEVVVSRWEAMGRPADFADVWREKSRSYGGNE
ncbi:S-adenosyl-L-methionine-dependent methyltransferase [Kockovaella imperatae]|uniref:DNA (cytosine-5-)-methyltransferase n=1 Tax=Kockovaella imperatae TaxID=4999 RepID=A0A1Y1UDT4_9TREE|nr:S-adenosyl-L-methionine-dependent methyltransferase [Kockovaella imperatae]ORX35235.1 S-adenosyl-L-methionine-dependent methyltransferase [Kockovaella imperatae]